MRSQLGLQTLKRSVRSPRCSFRPQIVRQGVLKSYCSSCEAPTANPHDPATSSPNPPIPPADHRQLGIEQELFITSPYSPGSPLILPNGARMFNRLTNFLRLQYARYGFQEVITPTIYKKSLWEKSGHWENYKDDMYSVSGRVPIQETEDRKSELGDEEYGLKPMNCPGHCLIFASKQRSYRELPIRYADFSPLHRNETSGALSGLTRVRRFHQDDGHIFCRPNQIRKEITNTLEFVKKTYTVFGMGPYRLALSTRPKDSFIGTVEEWDNAEEALKASLNESGQDWVVNEGDGAFYGPKIDIILKDSDGKEHQTATIQLDFQLPKRFGLEYQAPAPEMEQKGLTTHDPKLLDIQGPATPVLIHRAVLGSVERFMALLIEHYNGRYPFWLNPRQIVVLTVNNQTKTMEYVKKVVDDMCEFQGSAIPQNRETPWTVEVDDSPRSLSKKISEAKRKRYGVIVIIGNKDIQQQSITVNFSGIPDSEAAVGQQYLLRQNMAMHRWRAASVKQGSPNDEGDGGPDSKESKVKQEKIEWDRIQKQDINELPSLSAEELKSANVAYFHMRQIMYQVCEQLH